MSAKREDRNLVQVVVGLGILVAGVLFTLDNMGMVDAGDYFRYWPLALIGIGLAQIAQCRTWSSYAGALMWMLAGLWFLGRTVGLIHVGVGDLWPVILAGAGALLVFRGWRGYDAKRGGPTVGNGADLYETGDDGWITPVPPSPPPRPQPFPHSPDPILPRPQPPAAGTPPPSGPGPAAPPRAWASDAHTHSDNIANAFVIMGGVTRRLNSQDFKGGTVVAVMGGAKIDLRTASIAQGEAVIDVLAFWGGIEIKVPDDWVIVPQVFPFMGGFDDRTGARPPGARKRLVVRGLAVMGGVEVKH
jgi:hypothetical protein